MFVIESRNEVAHFHKHLISTLVYLKEFLLSTAVAYGGGVNGFAKEMSVPIKI